jgi:hypothetical protein
VRVPDSVGIAEALRIYTVQASLPRVTIVRGSVAIERANTHIILDGKLLPSVIVPPGLRPGRDLPGRNNAFNAALVYHLAHGDPEQPLAEAVQTSVERAFTTWTQIAHGAAAPKSSGSPNGRTGQVLRSR